MKERCRDEAIPPFGLRLTVVPFKFFQYLVLIEFTCDTSTLLHSNLNYWPLCCEENDIVHNLLNVQCPLANAQSLGIFQYPNFISYFSLWFIKMNPGFIACYNIINLFCQNLDIVSAFS